MKLINTKSFKLATISEGDKNAKRLAVILPGRLDTKDYAPYPSHLKLLSEKGFYAISFDPPGTWESPGGIELFTTTNYIKAAYELIKYYGNKPTLLFGHSRGGETAIHITVRNKKVIGLITVNASLGPPTPPNKKELVNGKYVDTRDLPPGTKKTKGRKKFVAPLTYFADGLEYDGSEAIKKIKIPKLMLYSIKDEFNSTKFVKKVFATIPKPKELHKLPGKHDYRHYSEVVEEVNKAMVKFIDKYLTE